MKQQLLTSYLIELGITKDTPKEEVAAAKAAFRKKYLKQKKVEFRQKNRSVTLSFLRPDARDLEKEARVHNMKLPEYLKSCVSGYREQRFVLPDNTQVQRIELALQSITNVVNQLERRLSAGRQSGVGEMQGIREQLERMEQKMDTLLRCPVPLETYLQKEMERDPQLVQILLRFISRSLSHTSHVH